MLIVTAHWYVVPAVVGPRVVIVIRSSSKQELGQLDTNWLLHITCTAIVSLDTVVLSIVDDTTIIPLFDAAVIDVMSGTRNE